ncbi:MAG: hypothetical protein AAFY76_06460, partial [Cyanobacteria bacterium J06649_11]
ENIFEIIRQLVKKICHDHNLLQFNEYKISNLLNSDYGFKLPPSVIKSASSSIKQVTRENGQFTFNEKNDYVESGELDEISESHAQIKDKLVAFVESKIDHALDETEKTDLLQGLSSFLLDSSARSMFSEYIGAFVLGCSRDEELYSQLQIIKEGFILYNGLEYEANVNELGSWIKPLTIYLDTEILFHAGGLNGELFLSVFNNFFDYVSEINRKNPKMITLKYFSSTKQEVKNYFRTAKSIVEKSYNKGPLKAAMTSIVNGCETGADVLIKESQFFESLVGLGILEDNSSDYFENKNHEYNIVSEEKVVELKTRFKDDSRVEKILDELNRVNIKRSNHAPKYFEDCRHLFLTGKGLTLNIAWDEELRKKCKIPLATNLTFIINRLWFKLNKGFGNNAPISFDVVKNAQVLLSSKLNDSIYNKFQSLKEKMKSGELDENQVAGAIVRLRLEARKPEEVSVDEIDQVIDLISERKIDRYLLETEKLNLELKEKDEKNEEIKAIVQKLEEDNRRSELEIEKSKISLKNEKNNVLEQKKETLRALRSIKVNAESQVLKRTRVADNLITTALILFVMIVLGLILKYGWDVMEPVTYFMSLVGGVFLIIYLIQTGRNFNLIKSREDYLKSLYSYEYNKMKLNTEKLKILEEECAQLEGELE